MPFTFKLSRRLALIYAAPLGAVLTACDPSDWASTGPTFAVASIEVSPSSLTLNVGESGQLKAIVRDARGIVVTDRVVTWASNDTLVAQLDQAGRVRALVAGAAAVTATSEGNRGTASVSVPPPAVASVEVSPATATVSVGVTVQLTATPKDSRGSLLTGRAVTWATSAPAVAAVSPSGLVTGVAAGSATITATSEGKSGTAEITVALVPVASVTVSPVSASLLMGATQQLGAVTKDSAGNALTGRLVTWETSTPTVATVSSSGLVAALSAGSATIKATSDGKSGTADITVAIVPVAAVTVSPASASVSVGQAMQLSATLKDANGNLLTGRPVTWASSAPVVAAVSAGGLVTGLALGAGTITATSEGQSGTAAITVTTSTANHYYAAPSGSDANPCSAAAPCYTMRRVSQLLAPGDTAHFASGNYTWSYSTNKVAVSGTASAPITYISDTKWGAKIYGSSCDPIWNDGDYVQIVNFDVTGNCSEGITTNGNYSKVIGNRVHDLPACTSGWCVAGILADCCNYHRTGIEIIGNVVDNIAMNTTDPVQQNTIHGIYLAGPNGVIMNNIVTRAIGACITLYHGSTREIVTNNVVANCGRYGIQVSADATITTNDYTTVNNNIVVNVAGRGIQEFPATGSHNVFNNNIVYNNSPNFDLIGGTQSGTITLTAAQFAALFVNYTGDMGGDYHLRSGALAIDAGTTSCAAGVSLCVPLIDFDSLLRPKGPALDIGAYEY